VLAQPWLLAAARTITAFGAPLVVNVAVLVAGIVLLVGRQRRAVIIVGVARLGELACETALKALLARPRPAFPGPVEFASGYSFPSGHAAGAAVAYGAIALMALPLVRSWVRLLLGGACVLVITAVGASRVLLGVHFPSDVVAGVALGLAWVGGAALLVAPRHADRT
jgi:undecaprenyl-diphosphatase